MRGRSWIAALLAAVTIIGFAGTGLAQPLRYPAPVQDGVPRHGPPDVTAAAWILYDDTFDVTLAAFAPDERRSVASTTKIMTALVALEEASLDEIVTISQRAAATGEREIGLVPGEEVKLGGLLEAALIHSGNDAATAIAEHVGGTVEGFVAMMNQRADALGLFNTSFANPHGLDAENHYSTAQDMLDLAREAMTHDAFRDIVRARMVVFPEAPDGTTRIGTATNLLLGTYDGVSGIKTGFTNQALLTFVASAEREGRSLYAVVLGSEGPRAHLADAAELFDYGFEELGAYGLASSDGTFVSRWPRLEPGPLAAAASAETMVHVAASGILANPPVSRETAPEPVPPPVTVTQRHPDESTGTVGGALRFWIERLFG